MWRACVCSFLGLLMTSLLSFGESNDEKIKKAVKEFSSKDAKVRLSALDTFEEVARINKKYGYAYVTDVVKLLEDKDAKIRGKAGETLGLMNPEDKKMVIGKVADALKGEKEENARFGMQTGLGALGALATDDDLKKVARDALMEARKKATDKREQKNIQAALQMITPDKKKKKDNDDE